MSKKRTQKAEETILELLAGGALITEACRELGIAPSTLNRWRRVDAEFDDKAWSAESQGIMIQRSSLIEDMREAIKSSDRGASIKIQGLHNLLHEVGRTASKLVSRMNDRAHLRIDANVNHQVIGWQDGFDRCPECGYEAPPNIIDGQATSTLSVAAPSRG